MTTLVWCCGFTLVTALALAVSGFKRSPATEVERTHGRPRQWRRPHDFGSRIILAGAGGAALGITTGWPVAAVGGLALGFFGRELFTPRTDRHAGIERTEAIAVWTEQLRDTMAAAAGLQQAIMATAPLAPDPIRPEITRAAAKTARQPLAPVLMTLAEELADPTADLVITALVLAATGEAQDLGDVLSTIASSARDDATMRRYVDASRARTRTAVRTITVVALLTVVGLLLVGHDYLHPYSSAAGQLVLALVLICYGTGVAVLHHMGHPRSVGRILAPAQQRPS